MTTARPMPVVITDGGRRAAGYRGDTGDCVTRAIAIATAFSYAEAYAIVNATAQLERPRNGRRRSSARTGVHKRTTRRVMAAMGWVWHPTMTIGSGCTTHLAVGELPPGRLIVSVSRHIVAVIDGTVFDTYDPTRGGTRCVYGYWTPPTEEGA